MTMPVRPLPVLQNWDCGGCSLCCRSYHIPVTDAERARIAAIQTVLSRVDYAGKDEDVVGRADPKITGGPEMLVS